MGDPFGHSYRMRNHQFLVKLVFIDVDVPLRMNLQTLGGEFAADAALRVASATAAAV